MDAFPVHEDQHRQMIFRIAICGKSKNLKLEFLKIKISKMCFHGQENGNGTNNNKNCTTELI
jgi:hypothetical protein